MGLPLVLALSSLMSAGANIYTGLSSAKMAQQGQEEANAMNYQIAQEQMAFQERMSNTAHQREVKDLTAAGLNPILSANSGATAPMGASAVMQNPNAAASGIVSEMGGRLASSASGLLELKERLANIDLINKHGQIASANAKEANAKAEVAERSKEAEIASIKSKASAEAVNSARRIQEISFDTSRLGQVLLKMNRAFRLLFGRESSK